jgi:hypothetical protein
MYAAQKGYGAPAPKNPALTTAAFVGPNWGTTPATSLSLFPSVIYSNFVNNPNINTQMSSMTWTMWAQLSTELTRLDTTGAYRPLIFEQAAKILNANNLIMMRAVFGSIIDTYVYDYTPTAATWNAYEAGYIQPPLYLSTAWYASKGTAPVLMPSTMAYYDVFLMAYTQQGDATPAVSLKRATTYLQVRMKLGPLDIFYIAGAVASMVAFFDPNAWADMKQWYSNTQFWPPQIDWPQPISLVPHAGGYPSDAPPSTVPLPDPTGGAVDPGTETIPSYELPSDSSFSWDFGDCILFGC